MKLAFALLLLTTGFAGLADHSKPVPASNHVAVIPDKALNNIECRDGTCSVVPAKSHVLQPGQPARNAWRFVFHGSRWWYFTDDCSWKWHDGQRWNDYSPPGFRCNGNTCVPVDSPAPAPVGTLSTLPNASVSGCSTCGSGRVGLFGLRRRW